MKSTNQGYVVMVSKEKNMKKNDYFQGAIT